MRFLTFVALFGAVAVTLMSCETFTYYLLGDGHVNVTMTPWKCLNGKFLSMPLKLVGKASEAGATRKNFNSNKRYYAMDGEKCTNPIDKTDGDERGHLVMSAIGGPNNDRWNMVPQRTSVNRKISKENNFMGRWDEFEKWMLSEINKTNTVYFTIDVNYEEDSGCRPVSFEVDGKSSGKSSTGYSSTFINRPGGAFATVALTQGEMKDKKPNDSSKTTTESAPKLKRLKS